MSRPFGRSRALAVGVSVFALIAVAAGSTLAASSNPATLYACYDAYGNVRMSEIAQCKLPGGGRLVSWGTAPVPGPTGPQGGTGPTGPTGPIGPQGAPGSGTGFRQMWLAQGESDTVLTAVYGFPYLSVVVTCLDEDTGYLEIRTSATGAIGIINHFQWTQDDGTTRRQDLAIAAGAYDNFHVYGGWGYTAQMAAPGDGLASVMLTISETDPAWLSGPGCDYLANWQMP